MKDQLIPKLTELLTSRKFWCAVGLGVSSFQKTGDTWVSLMAFFGAVSAGLLAEDIGKKGRVSAAAPQ